MNSFLFYFVEGWKHIISRDALDHQLFILALAIIYTLKDWRRVLILVTAFTIGHSLTLALSVFDIVRVPSDWVEFLIPVTIVLTASWNMIRRQQLKKVNTNYFLALFFGLIHGLGFANSIRMMLASDQSMGMGLFGFNLGLEAGQVVVVLLILLITQLLLNGIRIPQRTYIFVVSAIVLILSAKMAVERIPSLS
ncbi:HupE / UreJ protein [Niabella ginsenosidivorans]|uniref:HupE / UreJ protein n=1 Tax=Niabella ginsenosidivorans TaxID=1176587 RepID=A0A1A9HYT1_9BACT|nr:HupE/UreJ family protein [Niabella ginsenosidivorans]ANH79949.1 HupE / UreJ protein [Niabella ginsenosidivorans]